MKKKKRKSYTVTRGNTRGRSVTEGLRDEDKQRHVQTYIARVK